MISSRMDIPNKVSGTQTAASQMNNNQSWLKMWVAL